jgi:hypothetical protein
MPLLPKNNTLDYNPDATISASKKIKTIALERMKNPLEDPDQATLSTLDNQKNISSNFDRLLEMAGSFHNIVLRIQNILAPTAPTGRYYRRGRGRGKKGGSNGAVSSQELLRQLEEQLSKRRDEDFYSVSSGSTGRYSN